MSTRVISFDVRELGRHMARRRYQRGTLRASIPAHGGRPERRLPRGEYWAQWAAYVRMPDGSERRRQREKIITRSLAESHRIALDYTGPLSRSDAQRVLDLLIAQDAGSYSAPDTNITLAALAREYVSLSKPNWGPNMVRAHGRIIDKHLVNGELGDCSVADLTEADLQAWLNTYIDSGASRSMLKCLLLHLRGTFKLARKKKIMADNPTEDLRARSRRRPSERYLSLEECQRMLSVLTGRDRLIFRLFVQLGLRAEELFALRRDDVHGDQLRVDEALVNGKPASVKTEASAAFVYIPAEVGVELRNWMEEHPGEPSDWLFETTHGRPGFLNANNYRERILQPAAIRAGVGVTDSGRHDNAGKPILKTDVDFRALRRTCATHFGARAKDPKSTQAQLRHADPTITLKHYQKAIPASVKAAADQLEQDFGFGLPPWSPGQSATGENPQNPILF